MLSRNILVLATAGLLLSATTSSAAVYSCSNSDGSVHFTNAPTGSNCSPFVSERKKARYHIPNSSYNPSAYDSHIWRTGARYKVDPYLIKAVIRAESDFDFLAVSKKGAQGLMQLMPETAREMRVRDPFDPYANIEGGTRYLKFLLNTFDNDLLLSIAAYNAGPGRVKRANGVPRIPETVQYVSRVLKHYRVYRQKG